MCLHRLPTADKLGLHAPESSKNKAGQLGPRQESIPSGRTLTAKRAEQRRGGFDPCARSLQRETITVEMADKTKGAATNMEVTFANLQHGKRLKGKTRSRLHILVGLLFLGAVAGVAALIAKKGLPDIDPVKVRARSGIGPTACRAYTLVPTPRAPRRSPRSCR